MLEELEFKEKQLDQVSEDKEPVWRKFAPKATFAEEVFVNEVKTEIPIARRPRVKIAFAALLCGTIVGCLGLTYQLFSTFSASAPQKELQSVAQADNPSQMSEKEKLLFDRAYDQIQRSDNLKRNVPSTEATHLQRHPTLAKPKSSLQVVSTTLPLNRTNVLQHESDRSQFSPSFTKPRRLHNTPVISRQETVLPSRSNIEFSRSVSPSLTITSSPKPVDDVEEPMEVLRQVALAGIYSSGSSGAGAVLTNGSILENNQPKPSTQITSYPRESEDTELEDSVIEPTFSTPSVPVTTRVKGQTVTPISWMGNGSDELFRIQINGDLKAENGTLVLPKGTLMLAKVMQSNKRGYLNIQIVSIMVDDREHSISPDTILVKGENGLPLKAKVEKDGPGFLERVGSDILSAGVEGAAGAIGNRIVGGRVPQVQQIFTGRLRSLDSQGSQITQTVFVLEEGTNLELFINKPLSL